MLRNPKSLSPKDTVIKDPVLAPYFIVRASTGGFVVYKEVSKGENNTPYLQTISYPSNIQSALRVIAEEMIHNGVYKQFSSFKDYIQEWSELVDRLETLVPVKLKG